jgi:hypothetical protein
MSEQQATRSVSITKTQGFTAEKFFAEHQYLTDFDVCQIMGWNMESLIQKRARREAPASIRVKSIHLTTFAAMDAFIQLNAVHVGLESPAGSAAAKADLLGTNTKSKAA